VSEDKRPSGPPQGFADILGVPPAPPPPVNLNDARLPVHNAQAAYFARRMVETVLEAVEAAEARMAKIEKEFQRQQMRTIRGGRP
jgi:hypothetical protein